METLELVPETPVAEETKKKKEKKASRVYRLFPIVTANQE